MNTEKLVMMANQIAVFFASQGEERAVPQIARHIDRFWDPRMRRAMATHLRAGGAGLQPLAVAALQRCADLDASTTDTPNASPA